jgi:hypothetical protein
MFRRTVSSFLSHIITILLDKYFTCPFTPLCNKGNNVFWTLYMLYKHMSEEESIQGELGNLIVIKLRLQWNISHVVAALRFYSHAVVLMFG